MQLYVQSWLKAAIIKLQICTLLKCVLLLVVHTILPTAVTYLVFTARQHNLLC